jgi:murein L,D-transpeptidase YcbB/YkuD
MNNKHTLLLLAIIPLAWLACHNKKKKEILQDVSITRQTSFNNLFLDSTRLENFINNNDTFKNYRTQYFDFYKQRNYEYAWFDSAGLAEQAGNFINLLDNTITSLADSTLYNEKLYRLYNGLAGADSLQYRDSIPEAEMYLTGQFFAYAAKVYKGTDSDIVNLGWFIPRKKVNITALLDSLIETKATETDQFVPLNSQYKKLEAFLPKYYALQKKTVWDSIPKPAKLLHVGAKADIIPAIKQRLLDLGDLTYNDSTNVFDTALLPAVKSFQRRMGLGDDGVIGSKMVDELNVPINTRVQQILVNLERLRWMPADTDSNYVFVNIPEYKLYVHDSGKVSFTMNVIVGSAANNTVIFNGKLKYVVFAPYWNVPPSIVQKEVLPGIKRDRNYLAKNNMEVTGHSDGLPIVRQKPGAKNSLGLVKFLFPNSYNIYFHDTPNRTLFTESSRSLSHGCIRLGEPKKFAEFLLRDDTVRYSSHKIDSLMHNPKETWVTLKKTLPVFIGYFTAWVDKDGILNFRKDIYKHDDAMAAKLFIQK